MQEGRLRLARRASRDHGCGNCLLHGILARPMLVMVIGIAGLAFGREAAEGALFGEFAELIGPESAEAVQALLRSASGTRSGIVATAIGMGTLIYATTAIFGQLNSDLNVHREAPARVRCV